MIVSASYRTDVPAFYGEWFRRRLAAGWAAVANPYGGDSYRVDLTSDRTEGFVFWTRNVAPFRGVLDWLHGAGRPFIVQYTVTGYPRALESSVIEPASACGQIHGLARAFGPRVAVWRYDPLLATDLTPQDWHLRNFTALARALAGAVDECVISWATIYRKTARNMAAAARSHGFAWRDPEPSEKRDLVARLADIAADNGIQLTLCSQPDLLIGGARAASCVDAVRLSDVAGRPIRARRKGNRPGCECHESRDIGAYDTCPHGCVYCYAVAGRTAAKERYRMHDPDRPFLAG